MPKKIRFESAVHQFLTAVHGYGAEAGDTLPAAERSQWTAFIQSLEVEDDPSVPTGGIRVC